ncbi:MAG: glycine--tRNA ligase subunit beta [Henriciella sp.]|nr:glycine--tRNA ligase subunit beta [Henriciella sp.]
MADLLLELFCEEIPARMQAKAEADLKKAVLDGFKAGGLSGELKIASMSGPRRLAVAVEGLPVRSADVVEERKGPKVGAPEKAVEGFMRGAGLSDISEAEVRSDPKKGDFYVATRSIPGRDAPEIIAELVPEIVRGFHWPKSMRTGTGELRWVRPLQRILCVFDGKVVPFEIDGLASGDLTEGHRVHGRGPFKVTGLDDYVSQLGGEGHVLLTREDRRNKIEAGAKAVCETAGLELVEDKGLLEEVTGLAEWPVVILGDMDPAYLSLPPEVIQLSMRTHQKYFSVRDPKTGNLAPHFVVVANIEPADGGKAVAAGNRKVLSARLDDGVFFWENDKKTGLEAMAPKLEAIKFKDELGSIADKVERVAALARELAPKVGADRDIAERAARLCKADLVSEMVYEFPELQGVMGRYYALEAGEDTSVADAIRDHYKPQGPSDAVPNEPVAIAVALADKLDTLVGFWAIDEKPTGSKDPFALRRAALGVVRIVLENEVRLPLDQALRDPFFWMFAPRGSRLIEGFPPGPWKKQSEPAKRLFFEAVRRTTSDLLSFFADRLKQYLRDQGQRHDLIDAVFALGEDDLVLITKRVEALGVFLETEDGASLMAGYKRAANILKAEEKKDGAAFDGVVDESLLDAKAEKALFKAITTATNDAEAALKAEDFAAAMSALAGLRGPVDAFFDGPDSVMVNAEDAKVRANRLNLLNMMRRAIGTVADFSKIEG